MAKGRTVSANFLTELDKKILALCQEISGVLMSSIEDKDLQKEFKNDFGKISQTRDAGAGRGGGKLQRDAVDFLFVPVFFRFYHFIHFIVILSRNNIFQY